MDPLVWSVIFGFPVTLAAHAWLYLSTQSYPSETEIVLFQCLTVFFSVFPVVWRVIQPVPYFWTVCNVLMVLNLAWVPLTHSAVSQVRKTIAWTFVVVALPFTLLAASIFLVVTPTSNIGDNVCLACVSVATTCSFVHAYLVYMSIRPAEAFFRFSQS